MIVFVAFGACGWLTLYPKEPASGEPKVSVCVFVCKPEVDAELEARAGTEHPPPPHRPPSHHPLLAHAGMDGIDDWTVVYSGR